MNPLVAPFISLVRAPRAIQAINFTFFLAGLMYFGMLSLLGLYFNQYIGLNDIQSGAMVGLLTSGITLFMFILGNTAERIGPRKALFFILFFLGLGCLFFALAPLMGTQGLWSTSHFVALGGLVSIVIGMGINKPGVYASLNLLTGGRAEAVDYAMLYSVQQLGAFLPALFSPVIRHTYGMQGVFFLYGVIGLIGAFILTLILNKPTQERALSLPREVLLPKSNNTNFLNALIVQIKSIPIKNLRFIFLILIFMPIQTIYAHQWLTFPHYFTRAFTGIVKDYFEFFENLNPLMVFFIAPVVAIVTAKQNSYKMLIYGTLLMAVPVFLLAIKPSMELVLVFLVIRTIGESIMQPRFYQAITEMAPEGQKGLYISLADFPYMLTKAITASYSGWFLMRYCPAGVPIENLRTETMWTIHGCIALLTPIGLILAFKKMKTFIK